MKKVSNYKKLAILRLQGVVCNWSFFIFNTVECDTTLKTFITRKVKIFHKIVKQTSEVVMHLKLSEDT
jgi:hypothetical protein